MNSAWVCLEHLFFDQSSGGTFIKCLGSATCVNLRPSESIIGVPPVLLRLATWPLSNIGSLASISRTLNLNLN
jgi:hypothetical protein